MYSVEYNDNIVIMELRNLFGQKLRFLMESKSITFTELSECSNVNRDHLYNIVNGKKEIGIDTIEKLCIALDVEPSSFFNFNEFVKTEKIDEMIIEEFKKLPENFWDFADSKTDVHIHSLHPYPAVMIYPISNNILNVVTKYKKIESLLDPFCGSGTVLVEGITHKIKKIYGNDLNPLACLISKTKTCVLTNKEILEIENFYNGLNVLNEKYNRLIKEFSNKICGEFDITDKESLWSQSALKIINEYFYNDEEIINVTRGIKFKNVGFWFRPESLLSIILLKTKIDKVKFANLKNFFNCALSETIRKISNTRNSEFKLYRYPVKKIKTNYFDGIEIYKKILEKNLKKEKDFRLFLGNNEKYPNVLITNNDAKSLSEIEENSIDIIITSPPYGDSHTTVAYGQFSRLSNELLNLTNVTNIDSLLLGGKVKKSEFINFFGSKTLEVIYKKIREVDQKRANEVYFFYQDLNEALKDIAKKTKIFGYQFWVVGNRTVKKILIPTDKILIEMANQYNLKFLYEIPRNIVGKVMPVKNSPSNVSGDSIQTMTKENIIFFKKTI